MKKEIDKKEVEKVTSLVDSLGGVSSTARICKCSNGAVYYWQKNGFIPAESLVLINVYLSNQIKNNELLKSLCNDYLGIEEKKDDSFNGFKVTQIVLEKNINTFKGKVCTAKVVLNSSIQLNNFKIFQNKTTKKFIVSVCSELDANKDLYNPYYLYGGLMDYVLKAIKEAFVNP